jgi:hypothetical protein
VSRSPESGRLRLAIALIALVGAACSPTNPKPSPPATTPPATTIDIACTPERAEVVPALRGDPCPGAITAVELAVAPVRLPIRQIVIEPGPFYCDDVWPGVGSQPACYGGLVLPGQYMHAWATFERSDEVAAVMLGRDIPSNLEVPAAQPIPWSATLVTVEVPPAGWSMP